MRARWQDLAVLQVRCDESELEEYGEVLEIGQLISRPALPRSGGEAFFGTSLDEVPWELDRYHFLTTTPSVTIAGRIVAIAGVYALLTRSASDGWRPLPRSSWTEPVRSTADSRRVLQRTEWHDVPRPDGRVLRGGSPAPQEGDEQRYGWLLSLEDATVEPLESPL